MPDEVAMLLPTNPGPVALVDDLLKESGFPDGLILGLLLASPFLNVKVESARLRRAGFTRIANLPSVVQHDEEFSQQLADVDLGFERELECLSRFRAQGFELTAVVADARTAAAAAAIDPEIIIVLPRVADFAAGFPSLRQRGSAVQSAAESARETGWSGTLLG
ncbi:MAG TPA: phosphoenolpyruvate hydrolase family protein, partial [Arenicellales bacterium]|nr:phosphoenolpyruvate hydrolase family protein [Arenicellales bacterium]